MPTAVGPNTKGEENLVFGYDLGDVSNSYKGEPATNLITSGLPGYFGSGGQTLYRDRLYGLKSDSGVFQRNYVTNPALADSGTYNNNAGLYKTFSTATLNPATEFIQISFDFYMIVPYVRINSSGTGLNGYLGVSSTDSTVDNYGWNTTYSNGSGDDWSNNSAYVGKWQKVSLIVDLRDDKVPQSITAMYIYNDRTLQGEGIFTNFIITEHTTFPTGPIRYTAGTRSATQGLIDLTGNSTIDLSNVSFDSNGEMAFDGTNDYANITISPSQPMYCLETVFYNVNAIPGNDSTIGGPTTYQSMFRFNQDYPIGVNLGAWTSGMTNEAIHIWSTGAAPYNATNTRTAVASGWHHLVFNWNGSYYDIYVDGVQQDVYAHTDGHATLITLSHLTLGNSVSPNYAFNGNLNMVKIYNRSLTTSEISANFKAIKGRFNI